MKYFLLALSVNVILLIGTFASSQNFYDSNQSNQKKRSLYDTKAINKIAIKLSDKYKRVTSAVDSATKNSTLFDPTIALALLRTKFPHHSLLDHTHVIYGLIKYRSLEFIVIHDNYVNYIRKNNLFQRLIFHANKGSHLAIAFLLDLYCNASNVPEITVRRLFKWVPYLKSNILKHEGLQYRDNSNFYTLLSFNYLLALPENKKNKVARKYTTLTYFNIGQIYFKGIIFGKQIRKAINWHTAAASCHSRVSILFLYEAFTQLATKYDEYLPMAAFWTRKFRSVWYADTTWRFRGCIRRSFSESEDDFLEQSYIYTIKD